MLKAWKTIALYGFLLGSAFTAGVYADEVSQRVDAYLRTDYKLMIDGKPQPLAAAPLMYDSNVYLPVKELGNILGAKVFYRDSTNTIYISSRIPPDPGQADGEDPMIDSIKLKNPLSTTYLYAGQDYPVLTTYADAGSDNNLLYFRMSDLRRMGIDTGGLKKTLEKYTNTLYVSEQELRKRLAQPPVRSTKPGAVTERYVVFNEPNEDKVKALQKYIRSRLSQSLKDVQLTVTPLSVERLLDQEDTYEYLYYETAYVRGEQSSAYKTVKIKLKKSDESTRAFMVDKEAYILDLDFGQTNLTEMLRLKEQAQPTYVEIK